VSDLDDITQFLAAHAGGETEIIDTHISRVVIGPRRAWKIKKPVSFSYLDFSTRELRAKAAATELTLNRRTAPDMYVGLRRVTREASGALALEGAGETIETIVEMRRFDQADLFDAMAQRGALTADLMTRLTERIAAFHANAETAPGFGGAQGMAHILGIDEPALAASGLGTPARIAALDAALKTRLAALSPLLDARRADGKVRRCHGDLTLRNICMFEGEPTPFDCIEFDEKLGAIDVLYDLAFLLMDLTHRGLVDLANLVFNRYLDAADETDGLPALPFFMAVRATIRAHVTATQARNATAADGDVLRNEAQAYFDLAERLLSSRENILVAVGGFSGSGKSTVAAALAPSLGLAPGARILSSDRIRKALHGAPALQRLPQRAYTPEISERVYAVTRSNAARTLEQGYCVIADATFDRPTLAEAIAQTARDARANFAGFWLAASRETLAARVSARMNDPSDATVAVLDAQIASGQTPQGWTRLPADEPKAALVARALACLPANVVRT
jgi:uncharacterized protein